MAFQKGYKPWNKGKRMSSDYREKCKKRQIGKIPNKDTRIKMSLSSKGRKKSDSWKKKMSEKMKGRKITWKDKISKSRLGKKFPKLSNTRKRLFSEGKIKPSKTCFKRGNIPWNKGMNNQYHLWENKQHPLLGKKLTTAQKKNLSIIHKGKRIGKDNPMWRGGVTKINYKIRNSAEYKLWRKAVFERDNYTCRFCDQVGGKLNADHIKSFAQYPELRFAIDNGRTLCEDCHRKTENYGVKINKRMLNQNG